MNAFTFRIQFSDAVAASFVTMRDEALDVTGGNVTDARRVDGRSDLWEITVEPTVVGDVVIALPATSDCDATGAVCTSDRRRLETGISATVPAVAARVISVARDPDGTGPLGLTEHQATRRPFTVAVLFNRTVTGIEASELEVTHGRVLSVTHSPSGPTSEIIVVGIQPFGGNGDRLTLSIPADVEAYGNTAAPDVYFADIIITSETLTATMTSNAVAPVLATFSLRIAFNQEILFQSDGDSTVPLPGISIDEYLSLGDFEVVNGSVTSLAHTVESGRSVVTAQVLPTPNSVVVTVSLGSNRAFTRQGIGNQSARFQIAGMASQVSIAAVAAEVVEGAAAQFTLTRTGLLTATLTVGVSVAEDGAMLSGTPPATVTFEAESATASLSVATEDDATDEAASLVMATVMVGEGYVPGPPVSAQVTVGDNDNGAATGQPVITGTLRMHETLLAGTTGIGDTDGLAGATFTYQWYADDVAIDGATGSSHVLTAVEVDTAITVTVSFTDDEGHAEGPLTSAATALVQLPLPTRVLAAERDAASTDGIGLFPNQATRRSFIVFVKFDRTISGIEASELEVTHGHVLNAVSGAASGVACSGTEYYGRIPPVPPDVLCVHIQPTGGDGDRLTLSIPADVEAHGNAAAPDVHTANIVITNETLTATATSPSPSPVSGVFRLVITFNQVVLWRHAGYETLELPPWQFFTADDIDVQNGTLGVVDFEFGTTPGQTTASLLVTPTEDYVGPLTVSLLPNSVCTLQGICNAIGVDFSTDVTDDHGRGVTVSPNTLTVSEGGTATYTVVLTSPPTHVVTVTPTVTGDADVTVSPASLRFNPERGPWNIPQEVTVSAAHDADGEDDTATIAHAVVSSGDYAGVNAAGVGVTVTDDETASTELTLSVDDATVPESSRGQVITVTGTLSGAPHTSPTTVTVAVGAGTATETADYAPVTSVTLTIDAGESSGETTFTLIPVDDAVDEENETVLVTGTVSGLTVTGATVTIADDDTRGVTVSEETRTVREGGSATYTVVLTSQPTAAVTVTPAVTGDDDVTVRPASVRFTPRTWNTAQTVTVSAAHDADGEDDTAAIAHAVRGGDYAAVTAAGVGVTVMDDETASSGLTLSVDDATVPESSRGQVITVTGTLSGAPRTSPTTVTVAVGAGTATETTDYAPVSDITLTIAAGEPSGETIFTLNPVDDAIDEEDETVLVTGTVAGLTVTRATVTITDDDTRGVTVSEETRTVPEGGSATYTVVLTSQPTAAVTVTPAVTGDDDVTVRPASVQFTTTTWNTAQAVTVSAAHDVDADDDTATIAHAVSGGDYASVTAAVVSVTVTDDETASSGLTLSVDDATVPERSRGQVITVTGTLSGAPRAASTGVTVAVGAGTATETTDYAPVTSVTLAIAAGESSGETTFTLIPVDDAVDEQDETVLVTGTVAGLTVTRATVTIADDDTRGVTVSEETRTVREGGSATYTVVLTSEPTAAVTVTPAVTGDADVTVRPASVRFTTTTWNTAQTVTVSAAHDADGEDDTATIAHTVSTVSGGDYASVTAAGVGVTVTDDETASSGLTLSVDDATVPESSRGQVITVTGTLSGAPRTSATAVTVAVAAGTATETADYAPVTSVTLTIVAGESSGETTVTLNPVDDAVDEQDETVLVTGTVAGLTVTGAMVTITDDDTRGVTVSERTRTVPEGGSATYTVVLTSQPTEPVTVTPAVTGDDDVTASPASVQFTTTTWNTAQAVTVSAAHDVDADDDTATIAHAVSGGDYASVTAAVVGVTVTDDETASTGLTLSVDDATVPERSRGQVITVTGTLSGAPRAASTGVTVAVGPGTATETTDYAPVTSVTLTIAGGESSGETTFTLIPVDDAVDEQDETVLVTGTVAGLTVTRATVTITDDDTRAVTVSEETRTVREGGSATYTVVLTSQPTAAVTVTPAVTGDADVTVRPASVRFTTTTWNTAQTVTVSAAHDADGEDDTATIAHAVRGGDYASVTAAGVGVTVTDDETASSGLTLSVDDATVPESSRGQVITVTGTLSGAPRTSPTAVAVAVGAGTATETTDYAAVTSVTLTIAAGEPSGETTFTLNPVDDAVDEQDETVLVTGTVAGLTVTRATVTIADDDTRGVTVSEETRTVPEGGSATYTVVLTSQPTEPVTVTPAVTGDDDVTASPASVRFTTTTWNTAQAVTVSAAHDVDEEDDTAAIAHAVSTVSGGDYASVTAAGVGVTVTDDETGTDDETASSGVTLSVNPAAVSEGAGATTVTVTGTLSGAPGPSATTVTVAVGAGTATETTDYAPVSDITLTIPAGETSGTATFTLVPVDDDLDEADETVLVSGTAASGLTVTPTSLTIADDDGRGVVVRPTAVTVAEGGSGEYTVVLTSGPTGPVTIEVEVSGSPDVTALPTTLTFTPSNWNAPQTVTVSVDEDPDAVNDAATVAHTVSGGGYDGVTAESVEVTVTDDETGTTMAVLTVSPAVVSEGVGSAGQTMTVTGTLNGGTRSEATVVTVTVAGGTATEGDDFTEVADFTLTIPAGETSGTATFTLVPVDDDVDEDDETLTVSGTAASGLTVTPTSLTIADDEDTPTLSIADAQGSEDAGSLVFTVTLSGASSRAVTVDWETSDGTATAGRDYEAASGTVTFMAHETEQPVPVPVIGDNLDEAEQTFTLRLSNPVHALLGDAEAVGTIVGRDVLPKAWLVRFGRTAAGHVLDAVDERLTSTRGAVRAETAANGLEVTVGGRRVGLTPDGAAQDEFAALSRRMPEETGLDTSPAGSADGTRQPSGRDVLAGSAFRYRGSAGANGGTWSLWGGGAFSQFDGRAEDVALDGEVLTGTVGIDLGRNKWLTGLVLSRSWGDGVFSSSSSSGDLESSLTGLYPYLRYQASTRVSVWGLGGYGKGTLRLAEEQQTDMAMTMTAAGIRGQLLSPTDGRGLSLALATDALWLRATSDAVESVLAAAGEVRRLRLRIEGSYGGSLAPTFELGVRQDAGDAETGFGLEVGGGLRYAAGGLTADLGVRGLLAHEDQYFQERRVAGSIIYHSDPSSDLGLSFALSPSWGAASSGGGADALWARKTMNGIAPADTRMPGGRLDAELGYGVPVFGGRGVVTPYAGLVVSESGRRDLHLGWRLNCGPYCNLMVGLKRPDSAIRSNEYIVMLQSDVFALGRSVR